MKIYRKISVVFFFLAAFVLIFPISAVAKVDKKVGPGLYPALTLGYGYDDNIFRTEKNQLDDFIYQATPSITLFSLFGKHRFEANYFVDIYRFQKKTSADYEDQFLDGKLDLSLTRKLKAELEAAYANSHELRGASGTRIEQAREPDAWWADRYSAKVKYGRRKMKYQLALTGELYRRKYTNNFQESRSRDRSRIIGQFFWNNTAKTQTFFEAQYTNYDYYDQTAPINLTSVDQRYLVGVIWDATAKSTGEFKVGYLSKNMADPSLPDFGGWSAWSEFTYLPQKQTTLTFNLARGTKESSFRFASYYDSYEAGVSLNHDLTRRLTFDAELRYQNDIYEMIDNSDRTDTYTNGGAGLNYEVLRWLDVGLEYVYRSRDSTYPGIDYESNAIMISLVMDTMK